MPTSQKEIFAKSANSLVGFYRSAILLAMKNENEITVIEIESGLYVASYEGKEVSHGRTIYQATERAKEFLKNLDSALKSATILL